MHGNTYEAMELYLQTAIDRLGLIKKQILEGMEEFSAFREEFIDGVNGSSSADQWNQV